MKRLLSILLATLMALAIFTGCAATTATPDADPAPPFPAPPMLPYRPMKKATARLTRPLTL